MQIPFISGKTNPHPSSQVMVKPHHQPRLPFPFAIWSIDRLPWNPFLIRDMWPSIDSSSLFIEFLAFRKVAVCCSEFNPPNWNFQRKARVLPGITVMKFWISQQFEYHPPCSLPPQAWEGSLAFCLVLFCFPSGFPTNTLLLCTAPLGDCETIFPSGSRLPPALSVSSHLQSS